MRINRLSPQVANQIAAGEVIERPASVIKELLENALDAGAKQIHIDVGFGGLNLIRVSDNGAGIVADDLMLAIAPHATSKIKQLDDLANIESMGFRGEALASIASVSRLTLASKPANQSDAMQVQSDENGCRQSLCARNQGTTVEVLDLFYNTPVRKKFLKGERIEFQVIETVIKRFALSATQVSLSLKHNGKEILVLPAANDAQSERLRIQKILGNPFMDDAIEIDTQYGHLCLRGWLSAPSYQRSQRDRQWTYLNRRMIQDKLLYHAIHQAYQAVLHPGRYATCLLYLTVPAGMVDVNVHPTKHEVRFQTPRMVHDFLVSAIAEKLDSCTQDISITPRLNEPVESSVQEHVHTQESPLSATDTSPADVTYQQYAFSKTTPSLNETMPLYRPPSVQSILSRDLTTTRQSWYVVNARFVLVTTLSGQTYLVHAQAAYQAMCRARIELAAGSLMSRPLLVPIKIAIHKKSYFLLDSLQAACLTFGIDFDFLSEADVLIRSVPKDLPQFDIKQFFTDLLSSLVSPTELLECVIDCQFFDAYHCVAEEQAELLYFIQSNGFPNKYCKQLDEKTCLGVMTDA